MSSASITIAYAYLHAIRDSYRFLTRGIPGTSHLRPPVFGFRKTKTVDGVHVTAAAHFCVPSLPLWPYASSVVEKSSLGVRVPASCPFVGFVVSRKEKRWTESTLPRPPIPCVPLRPSRLDLSSRCPLCLCGERMSRESSTDFADWFPIGGWLPCEGAVCPCIPGDNGGILVGWDDGAVAG